MSIGIVCPTKTDAYARRLLRSLATCEPDFCERTRDEEYHRVVFVENGLTREFFDEEERWPNRHVGAIAYDFQTNADGSPKLDEDGRVMFAPFIFARAINLGVAALDPRADILIMNDDAVFCSPHPITTLEALLEEQVDVDRRVRDVFGVIGPRIEGGVGNPDQTAPLGESQILETDKAICFVAALIPRKVWEEIGGLDERFVGYGYEDNDAGRRIVRAGYKLGVTGAATVRHVGNDATGQMHGTFSRLGREEHTRLYLLNQQIYAEKWGESGRGDVTRRKND